ncbi:MAG: ABC transporter ATP-binding protein, partial [Alistipes sp.]|nr:ABC transporter ATP-binding protein [Alistipes sp.]
KKEQEKQIRRLKKAVESVEAELAAVEEQIALWDTKLAEATEYIESDYATYNSLKERYDHLMHEWEKRSYELELVEEQ